MKIYRTLFGIIFFLVFSATQYGQNIEKKWEINDAANITGSTSDSDIFLKLDSGRFEYSTSNDIITSKGDYIFQNDLLLMLFDIPKDSMARMRVSSVTDSTLVLSSGGKVTRFTEPTIKDPGMPAETISDSDLIVPSAGFSFQSFYRGMIGMISLILIAFLFSANRRAINWKTVGLGLAFQLIIAIGVLRVGFIKSGFETVGQLFVNVLDYTRAGSEFLLGGMLDVNSFGFIFAFQVLPTIIFFSALTSVLFYFGIIQIVVKGMGWLLTKILHISGAESLSVAGNIFLGKTEA